MRLITRKRLEAMVWTPTHRNFRGKYADGTKTILNFVPSVGTCLVPMSSLTDAELLAKLPAKVHATIEIESV